MKRCLFVYFLFLAALLPAQDVLRVGLADRPPYCMQDADGNWYGMAVQLWRHVAEARQLRYHFTVAPESDSLLQWLAEDSLDVVLYAPLNPAEEGRIDYLQAYHRTSLGLALRKENGLKQTIRGLFSLQFLYIVVGLSVLLLVVGVIVYLLERNGNEDHFGGDRSVWQGIGSGFWWAGVTMTTIGYGDKAPRTLAGRAVAMLWMLVALAVTSSLTAAIIAATNRPQTVQFPRDLRSMRVGVVAEGPAANYFATLGQEVRTYPDTRNGLEALSGTEVDAFVDDVTALRYLIDEYRSLSATIETTDAEIEALAFAVQQDSPLREPLDQTVIQITLTEMWREIMTAYDATRNGVGER